MWYQAILIAVILEKDRNQIFILSIVTFVTIPKDTYVIGLLSEEKHLVGEGASGLQSPQIGQGYIWLYLAYKWYLIGLLIICIKNVISHEKCRFMASLKNSDDLANNLLDVLYLPVSYRKHRMASLWHIRIDSITTCTLGH